ncbi:MAG: type II secretion system protein [Sinobacterium sp.]|nr:type II secretion system protein [Sinobacterium sp.]
MPSHTRQRGFTLIEIMAVMLLVGMVMSMVMVSVGDGNRGKKVQSQVRELYHSMHLLLEEAVFVREQYGIRFDLEQGEDDVRWVYNFLVFDAEERLWQVFETDDLRSNALFERVDLRLEIDGEIVELGTIANEEHRLFKLDEEESKDIKLIEPDIYFLSSGETQNFKLYVLDKGLDGQQQFSFDDESAPVFSITGNILGQVDFWMPGESADDEEFD